MAITAHDIVSDSPTNNFATMSPLDEAGGLLFSEGNLKITANTGWDGSRANFSYPLTGKWYWETFCVARSTGASVGILSTSAVMIGDLANSSTGYVYNSGDGSKYNNASWSLYGNSWGQNNIIGVLWDSDTATLTFYKDGISQGAAWSGLTGEFSPAIAVNGSDSMLSNFGQDPTFGGASNLPTGAGDYDTDASGNSTGGRFAFQPPTDALALCTANLPDFTPDVTGDVPQDYFKAVLYTGNGGTQSITGVGFQPDFVWGKHRNGTEWHILTDAIRGATKSIFTNSTDQEVTRSDLLTSFDSDGFSLGSYSGLNGSGHTYVAWCWKAGGNSNTFNINGTGYSTYSALQTANTSLPASSTSGMIVPSGMSINTNAGFSIVTYTASTSAYTFCHGLNEAPEMILFKNRDRSTSWSVYHKDIGATKVLRLNTTATATTSGSWNNTSPTSTVVHNGGLYVEDCVAYCWHSVEGYSKFGSYTGNGSPDGPFVYCGFRPAFVMYKSTTGTAYNWGMYDTARDTYNVAVQNLTPNTADQDTNYGGFMDILSNGFKCKAIGNLNETGSTYIFMAFAEQPFKFSNAR